VSPTIASRFPALTYPDARQYLLARFLVSTGVQMQTVAVGWQVYPATPDGTRAAAG
jgi:hypothetical protein